MSEMVERVAATIGLNAISWTRDYKPEVKWPGDYSEPEQRRLREIARAVLEAMREPTHAMVTAALDVYDEKDGSPSGIWPLWHALIDEALK